jgi:Sulfotransferase domain
LSASRPAIELRAARLAIKGAAGAYRQQRAHSFLEAARSTNGKPIFVVCLPKSASTFLALVLAAATGRRTVPAMPSFGRREQEFDAFSTLALRDRAVVLQSHTRYSQATRYFLQEVGTPPVLIVRDLFDSLISLWDHLRNEGPEVPVALVHRRDLLRDDAEMLDFLVDIVAVWYVQFFAGWMRGAASGAINVLVLDYETVTADPALAIESVCRHIGDPTPPMAVISQSIEHARLAKPRFNQGTSGRGARFGPERLARVERLAAFYPDVDFSPIGIGRQPSTQGRR